MDHSPYFRNRLTGLSERTDEFSPPKGALIVHAAEENRGAQVEASKGRTVYANVVERQIDNKPSYAAVFPDLSPGTYTVNAALRGQKKTCKVTIADGIVAEVDWR